MDRGIYLLDEALKTIKTIKNDFEHIDYQVTPYDVEILKIRLEDVESKLGEALVLTNQIDDDGCDFGKIEC